MMMTPLLNCLDRNNRSTAIARGPRVGWTVSYFPIVSFWFRGCLPDASFWAPLLWFGILPFQTAQCPIGAILLALLSARVLEVVRPDVAKPVLSRFTHFWVYHSMWITIGDEWLLAPYGALSRRSIRYSHQIGSNRIPYTYRFECGKPVSRTPESPTPEFTWHNSTHVTQVLHGLVVLHTTLCWIQLIVTSAWRVPESGPWSLNSWYSQSYAQT